MATNVSLRELAEAINRIDERTARLDQTVADISVNTARIDQTTNVVAAGMRLPSGITLSNAVGQILAAVSD